MEITGGRCSLSSLSELDEFLAGLTAAKNRFFNASGHSPAQLVFGEMPRVPAELLSSHSGDFKHWGTPTMTSPAWTRLAPSSGDESRSESRPNDWPWSRTVDKRCSEL